MKNTGNERLRKWMDQDYTMIPQIFFQHYKELNIQDDEALLLLHLMAFHREQNDFPTPSDFIERMNDQKVTLKLQRLMQKGFLEITQGVDQQGKLFEKYSLFPLWERLFDLQESNIITEQEHDKKLEEGELFTVFEQEFGRLLSPMEIETISMWLDSDHHSPEIIKEALKEAVLAGKLSFRYIDRILFEWKKKNITSIQQVKQHTDQFHQKTTKVIPKSSSTMDSANSKKVSFYNWLEERE